MIQHSKRGSRRRVADSVTESVVAAIADAKGVEPLALDVPLYEVVDPEALEAVFESDADVRVSFTYDGLDVVVEGEHVLVGDAAE